MPCINHRQCINDALTRAEAICARSGARFTQIRRDVLREIWSSHEAVKAYDLIERLSRDGEQLKPPTVYRALDFLLEQGLIHRIESLNAFVGCERPQEPHQAILMICEHCSDIEESDGSEVQTVLTGVTGHTGFIARSAVIELRGLCRRCR
ncbi:MAG: transcriptional repressor [Halothiobacillaceae bacterium]